jgi:hypothetical protein
MKVSHIPQVALNPETFLFCNVFLEPKGKEGEWDEAIDIIARSLRVSCWCL